jgi:alkylmercury lyase-like protein
VLKAMSHSGPTRLVGFSRTPTLYTIVLPENGDVYLKCGADILLTGLTTNLEAEARCPACGTITRFRVAEKRIEDVTPRDPILHVVEFEMSPGHLGIECKSTHIFDKNECLDRWLSTYTGRNGRLTSLPEYMVSLIQRPPRKVSPA